MSDTDSVYKGTPANIPGVVKGSELFADGGAGPVVIDKGPAIEAYDKVKNNEPLPWTRQKGPVSPWNGKTFAEMAEELAKPFNPSEIEWRIQSSGKKDGRPWAKCLAYITGRAVMHRLDQVCTPWGWEADDKELSDGNFLVGIGIDIGSRIVWKWDGAARTKVKKKEWSDEIEKSIQVLDTDTNLKGGLSAGLKRAAVHWGIGRYLYYLTIGWANIHAGGKMNSNIGGEWYKWDPPTLPPWAIPAADQRDIPDTIDW